MSAEPSWRVHHPHESILWPSYVVDVGDEKKQIAAGTTYAARPIVERVQATDEELEMIAAVPDLIAVCKRLAAVEIQPNATPGTWVAHTLFCNRQITAADVLAARAALAKAGVV